MEIPFIQKMNNIFKRSPKSDYPVFSQSNMKVIVIAYFHQKAAIYQLASCFLCALRYPGICKQSSFIMMSSPHLTLLYATQKIKVNNGCHKNMRTNFKLFWRTSCTTNRIKWCEFSRICWIDRGSTTSRRTHWLISVPYKIPTWTTIHSSYFIGNVCKIPNQSLTSADIVLINPVCKFGWSSITARCRCDRSDMISQTTIGPLFKSNFSLVFCSLINFAKKDYLAFR